MSQESDGRILRRPGRAGLRPKPAAARCAAKCRRSRSTWPTCSGGQGFRLKPGELSEIIQVGREQYAVVLPARDTPRPTTSRWRKWWSTSTRTAREEAAWRWPIISSGCRNRRRSTTSSPARAVHPHGRQPSLVAGYTADHAVGSRLKKRTSPRPSATEGDRSMFSAVCSTGPLSRNASTVNPVSGGIRFGGVPLLDRTGSGLKNGFQFQAGTGESFGRLRMGPGFAGEQRLVEIAFTWRRRHAITGR